MSKNHHHKTSHAPIPTIFDHRLCVAHSELTLAKRPAESTRITELYAAVKSLAREAARADHTQKSKEQS